MDEMGNGPQYRVNAPHVLGETIGGEAMIVNLATGHYFSLQGSGADIWAEIERGRSHAQIVDALEQRYVAEAGEIEAAVRGLIEELESENLVVRVLDSGMLAIVPAPGADDTASEHGSPSPVQDRQQFDAPALMKFTDMQDIILLDPVHEVDASGWPHASASS